VGPIEWCSSNLKLIGMIDERTQGILVRIQMIAHHQYDEAKGWLVLETNFDELFMSLPVTTNGVHIRAELGLFEFEVPVRRFSHESIVVPRSVLVANPSPTGDLKSHGLKVFARWRLSVAEVLWRKLKEVLDAICATMAAWTLHLGSTSSLAKETASPSMGGIFRGSAAGPPKLDLLGSTSKA
jgi:hypothetical protein